MSDQPQQLSATGEPVTDPAEEEGRLSKLWNFTTQKYGEIKEKVVKDERVQSYTATLQSKGEEWGKYGQEKREQLGEYSSKKKEEIAEYSSQKKEAIAAYSKEKYDKAMENERIKGAVDFSLEKGEKLKQGTKVVLEKAGEIKGKIVNVAKERTSLTRERTKALWSRGKGKIIRLKNDTKANWGKSAQETLLAREEAKKKWDLLKIRGAEDITVPARKEYTTMFHIEKGTIMRWSFRVKDYDIGFGVRLRLMRDGGAYEEDVLTVERFDNTDTIEGSWVADADRTIVLVFDNSYSKLRSKTVAYMVGTESASKEVITEVKATEVEQEKGFELRERQIAQAEQEEASGSQE